MKLILQHTFPWLVSSNPVSITFACAMQATSMYMYVHVWFNVFIHRSLQQTTSKLVLPINLHMYSGTDLMYTQENMDVIAGRSAVHVEQLVYSLNCAFYGRHNLELYTSSSKELLYKVMHGQFHLR